MAENQLYDIHHGDDQPASQTMNNEPERPEQMDPPPVYTPPTGQQYSPTPSPPYQGYTSGYQPQPNNQPLPCPSGYQPQPNNQPPPGPSGYQPQPNNQPPLGHSGYQQFGAPHHSTSTSTTVVVGAQMQAPMFRPSNFLAFSILSAIFCCPIFGIIGIIYSVQVDPAYDRGDYWKASSNSSMAKGWSIAALVCGLVIGVPLLIYFPIAIASAASSTAADGV